jgi:hypothetical protein
MVLLVRHFNPLIVWSAYEAPNNEDSSMQACTDTISVRVTFQTGTNYNPIDCISSAHKPRIENPGLKVYYLSGSGRHKLEPTRCRFGPGGSPVDVYVGDQQVRDLL